MSHPSPFSYQKKEEVEENIIGHFAVTFQQDINHEYFFVVYKDGKIFPCYDFEDDTLDLGLFYKYLQDENLHSVIFYQLNGKRMNYKW